MIIEQADAEGGEPSPSRDGETALRVHFHSRADDGAESRCDQEEDGQDGVGPVQPMADPRFLAPDAIGIEPCRRQPQPLEDQGGEHHGTRGGEAEQAEIRRPHELGQKEAEAEIEPGIQDEGDDYGHAVDSGRRIAGDAPQSLCAGPKRFP